VKKATVIIPTTGSDTLQQTIESVLNQEYENVQAYVVVDGNQYKEKVENIVSKIERPNKNIVTMIVPENVGADGFYGHRIYAATTHLVNSDYVLYLDQDCWIDNNHVNSLVKVIEENDCYWSYSLRKIVDKDGVYICNDECESLGKWRPLTNYNHIDTNCYCLRTDIAIKISQVFHGKWGQDRIFYQALSQHFQKYDCSGQYTLNYRLGGNEGSVSSEFFLRGNEQVAKMSKSFPWRKNA
jgi:glycosyltransferase involved in cell wall biosynthesis